MGKEGGGKNTKPQVVEGIKMTERFIALVLMEVTMGEEEEKGR